MGTLLIALVLFGQVPEPKFGPENVMEHDWVAMHTENGKTTWDAVLSLQPKEKWHEGTAWVIFVDQSGDRPTHVACRGTYAAETEDGKLARLRLVFTRRYVQSGTDADGRYTYVIDAKYGENPTGIDLEVTAEPGEPMECVVTRAFWVNGVGRETKRVDRVGFLDALKGAEDEEIKVKRTGHLQLGTTYRFTTFKEKPPLEIVKVSPPGFKLR